MPIKICLVLLRAYAVFRPELREKFGGAEVQFYMLARELAKDPEVEVTVVSRDFGQPDEECIDGVRHRKIAQGPDAFKKIKPIRDLHSARGLYRALGAVDADVYLQFCAGIETGIVSHYCRRRGKAAVHMIASDRGIDGGYESASPLPFRLFFRYGVRHSRRILCQNLYQQHKLEERFGKTGPITMSLCEMPEKYAPPTGDSILWVSRLLPMKKPEIFFDLARAFPSRRFVMIGNTGPDADYFEKIKALSGDIDNLEFIPTVPYQEIDDYFARARVFVNTSDFEGFPNTFLQAMKHGAPILSLSVNPDDLLTREGIGLAAEGDEKKLVAGLNALLDDEKSYQEMSRRAFDYVARHHDSRVVTRQIKDMALELINRS